MTLQQLSIGATACCLAVLLLTMSPAHAYLDPGMGSYVFQIVIAGAIGAVFAIKLFFRRLFPLRKPLSPQPDEERDD